MWEERIGDRCKEARGESTNASTHSEEGQGGPVGRKRGSSWQSHLSLIGSTYGPQYLHLL